MKAQFVSAGTGVLSLAFAPEEDCDLVGFLASKQAALSYDGASALVDFTGPTASATKKTFFAYVNAASITGTFGMRIPLIKGETVYLISAGGTAVILYLEPNLS